MLIKHHEYFTYIVTNLNKTVLYVGMMNDLPSMVAEHYFNQALGFGAADSSVTAPLKRPRNDSSILVLSWFVIPRRLKGEVFPGNLLIKRKMIVDKN